MHGFSSLLLVKQPEILSRSSFVCSFPYIYHSSFPLPSPPHYTLIKELIMEKKASGKSHDRNLHYEYIKLWSRYFLYTQSLDGDFKEIDRADITITNRMGIGEFGPIFDAEVKLDVNDVQRAMIKASRKSIASGMDRNLSFLILPLTQNLCSFHHATVELTC
jgi:hypothetical protein